MAGSKSEDLWKNDMAIKFADIFTHEGKVLEIGSAIASNENLFPGKEYIGLDVAPGPGVTMVSIAHEYDAPNGFFDIVCSFSELEHDLYWKKTLKKMVELTRSGGLIFFSCCFNWEEHGTMRTSPKQSLTQQLGGKWINYYKNITPDDVRKVWDLDKLFSSYYLGLNPYDDGLTAFWGIKK